MPIMSIAHSQKLHVCNLKMYKNGHQNGRPFSPENQNWSAVSVAGPPSPGSIPNLAEKLIFPSVFGIFCRKC